MKKLLLVFCLPIVGFIQTKMDSNFRFTPPSIKPSENIEYFKFDTKHLEDFVLPIDFVKPEKWRRLDSLNAKGEFYGRDYDFRFSIEQVVDVLKNETDFGKVCSAKSFCLTSYRDAFPFLVGMLSDKSLVGLTNTADLIIPGRAMTFYGHGGIISYDLFTVAGRAAWILQEMTGEEFGVVGPSYSEKDVKPLQQYFRDYILINTPSRDGLKKFTVNEPKNTCVDLHQFIQKTDNSEYEIGNVHALPMVIEEFESQNGLFVLLDTNRINSWRTEFLGYSLMIGNKTKSAVDIPTIDGRLTAIAEVFYDGEWQPIELVAYSNCGNSYYSMNLKPESSWFFVVPKYTGEIETKLRYKLVIHKDFSIYSNEINASFNLGQIVKK